MNISRTVSPRGTNSPLSSFRADAGSRPGTTHSTRKRVSVSGPTARHHGPRDGHARRPTGSMGSRSGLRTAGGLATPPKTPELFKYLRRRTVSPATMRYFQIKDDLALLMQKHKRDVEKEHAREERLLLADKDRLAFEEEARERAARQFAEAEYASHSAESAQGEAEDTEENLQQQQRAKSLTGGPVADTYSRRAPAAASPADAGCIGHSRDKGQAKQEAATLMADLSARMKLSFRSSINKVTKRTDPLEQRLVNKQAVGVERSEILTTLAALRGQRHRVVQQLDQDEQERREKYQQEARLDPVPCFSVGTKWGEVAGGDTSFEFYSGDGTWLKESLLKKDQVLSGLSDYSSTLVEHMPVLADMQRQREELEEERHALAANVQELRKTQQNLYETATFQARAEKLKGEHDALRLSWSGATGVRARTMHNDEDSWKARERTPPNYPFKPHYPEPPRAPVHEGNTKELARQALLRLELSDLLRKDSALKGLVPSMPQTMSRRVAPHMYNVMSCVPTEEKERIAQSSWPAVQPLLHEKSRLDPSTGKLINSSMKLAHTSIVSNNHSSTLNSQLWTQTQSARSWEPTSTPGPTPHPVSCCCLSCSLNKQGEQPTTRLLYRRLSTHEAGNALNFAKTGQAVRTWPDAQQKVAQTSPLSVRARHPQVPHGFRSPPRPAVRSPTCCNSIKGQLKEIDLSEAVRGGLAQSLLFAAKVSGLVESPPR